MPRTPNHLTDHERLLRAKERTRRLMDHISALFLMHEANHIVIYSPALADQVPRSYAAHAFNQFQKSMHLFEIGRLCALWDVYDDDRESIPAIVCLIDRTEVIDLVVHETHDHLANQALPRDWNPDSDTEMQVLRQRAMEQDRAETAAAEAEIAKSRLTEAISLAQEVVIGPTLSALREFRHTYIAHNLALGTFDERADIRQPKYGDEADLLERTVEIAGLLNLGLNGVDFGWKDSRRIARRNAEALWNGCKFKVLE